MQGLCESVKTIFSRYCVQTYFKGNRTLTNILITPKDKDPVQQECGIIYQYECNRLDCNEVYIGESSRTLSERFKKEHLKVHSPIYGHHSSTGHTTTLDNCKIVDREGHFMRTI